MSGSFPIFDTVAQHCMATLGPARTLDIGAGAGKYARLLQAAAPRGERLALEIEASYLERFGLEQLYHRVDVAGTDRWWHYDGQSHVRPCRLRLVDHGREVAYRPR